MRSRTLLPTLALTAAGALAASVPPRSTGLSARGADPTTIIVQLFQWNWDSVAQECTDFIGPAGYTHVQVSPATEHVAGDQWYLDYQTVSYKINSRRGNADQFANMVSTCQKAGVGVILDTTWNHMAGQESGVGSGGTPFTQYNYENLYTPYDFHYCETTGHNIDNYGDKYQNQFCQLDNLADLKTESDYVRSNIIQHANQMLGYGIAGFRLDAAKHIPVEDLSAIISGLSRRPFITSEVIGAGPPIPQVEYSGLGIVSASDFQATLRDAFTKKGLSTLQDMATLVGGLPSDAANTWVCNQDSERGHDGGAINYQEGAIYELSHVFTMTHDFGIPTILSSYSFSDPNAGAPNGAVGTCSGNGGANGWLCQHRWMSVSNLVPFRKAAAGAGTTHWQNGSPKQIAYERDGRGFVAINNEGVEWNNAFDCGLPDGTYCDIVAGGKNGAQCTGSTVTVAGGKCNAKVPPQSAVVIYNGSKL